jgi:hypothetical protein
VIKTVNYLLLFATTILMISCDLSSDEASLTSTDNMLAGTQWKLGGVMDVKSNVLQELELVENEDCSIIAFDTDTTGWIMSGNNHSEFNKTI